MQTLPVILLLLKVSLWGGSLTADEAAALAIATIASFVVTGGFVQAIPMILLYEIGVVAAFVFASSKPPEPAKP